MKAVKETVRKYYKVSDTISLPTYSSQSEAESGVNSIKVLSGSEVYAILGVSSPSTSIYYSYHDDITIIIDLSVICDLETYSFTSYGVNNGYWASGMSDIYGSNDLSSWIYVGEGINGAGGTVTISKSGNLIGYYRYIKFTLAHPYPSDPTYARANSFTMTFKKLTESTSSDYDIYIDTNNYRVAKIPVMKYYKYSSTEFNGTQIGGTIADKKFTGASGAYLQVDDYYKLNSATSWEIQTKYTYNGGGTYPWIIDAYPSGISLYVYTTGQFAPYVYNVFDVTSSVYASVGTTYYIKFGYTGSQYYCSYNTTGWNDTFTDMYRATSSNKLTFNYLYLMAMPSVDASTRWSVGPTDLSETRIICDGKVVWNALQYSESTSTDYDFYKDVDVYYGVNKQ